MKKIDPCILVALSIIIISVIVNIGFSASEISKQDTSFPGVYSWFSDNINKNVSEDSAGLSLGYLLGDKNALPDGLLDKVKTVGLAHIIVVSGTHLSIIVSTAQKLFSQKSRKIALLFAFLVLAFYVPLVGVSSSLIRASIATALSLLAWYTGVQKTNFRTVLYVLALSLLVNPFLLGNLSFQLSMLAYTGILLVFPELVRYFYGRDRPSFIGKTIMSTVSATIVCLPLQLYFFGSFSLLSVVANVLILPTISITIWLSFLTGLTGLRCFGMLLELILSFHIEVINWLYDMDGFVFVLEKNNPVFLVAYVLIVVVFIMVQLEHRMTKRKKEEAFIGLRRLNIWNV